MERYLDYLRHFGPTCPMLCMHRDHSGRPAVALRHDVDHDLDHALEMSFHENALDRKATYFILPTAGYWQDPRLLDKCLQIQDFGHEIGLHLNLLTEWWAGRTDGPEAALAKILDRLRAAGLDVKGVSAHGDRLCYENHYINYWLFRELRPASPAERESGLTAEGVAPGPGDKTITYPSNHRLKRPDGATFDLWSISMKDHGLEYDAAHVACDRYFTDSGGAWKRSPDPRQQDLRNGRHQVLIHPEWWPVPRRIYFFLSTARSGSKWLAEVLQLATPLETRHEFALNHRLEDGKMLPDHITGAGFAEMSGDKASARERLLDLREWLEKQAGEPAYGEVNVYLENFLEQLEDVFPEATLVHLHRHPGDVVRSLLIRGWYATPQDTRHPRIDVAGWSRMSQLEKTSWYVRAVHQRLLPLSQKISFEEMVCGVEELGRSIRDLGLPFYPRLAAPLLGCRLNQNKEELLPPFATWPQHPREIVATICEPVFRELRYDPDQTAPSTTPCIAPAALRILEQALLRNDGPSAPAATLFDLRATPVENWHTFSRRNLEVTAAHEAVCCRAKPSSPLPGAPPGNWHLVIGTGDWHQVERGSGWKVAPGWIVSGEVAIRSDEPGEVRLFGLEYDTEGRLIKPPGQLASLGVARKKARFSFRTKARAASINIALQARGENAIGCLWLEVLQVKAQPPAGLPSASTDGHGDSTLSQP
jgi:hypothetical protein